jgi:hypothetical protein
MPKLNGTHLPERLASRLADLKSGKEVAARDTKSVTECIVTIVNSHQPCNRVHVV